MFSYKNEWGRRRRNFLRRFLKDFKWAQEVVCVWRRPRHRILSSFFFSSLIFSHFSRKTNKQTKKKPFVMRSFFRENEGHQAVCLVTIYNKENTIMQFFPLLRERWYLARFRNFYENKTPRSFYYFFFRHLHIYIFLFLMCIDERVHDTTPIKNEIPYSKFAPSQPILRSIFVLSSSRLYRNSILFLGIFFPESLTVA